jgi:DNA repair exonuclease SbcCD ATPase subunit
MLTFLFFRLTHISVNSDAESRLQSALSEAAQYKQRAAEADSTTQEQSRAIADLQQQLSVLSAVLASLESRIPVTASPQCVPVLIRGVGVMLTEGGRVEPVVEETERQSLAQYRVAAIQEELVRTRSRLVAAEGDLRMHRDRAQAAHNALAACMRRHSLVYYELKTRCDSLSEWAST